MKVVQLSDWPSARMRTARTKTPARALRKAAPLTVKQFADAAALKQCWDAIERSREVSGRPHSKKDLAHRWGVHPSNVSQYINGHIPLNIEAQLRFADYLEVVPTAIWPDWEFRHLVPGRLTPEAIEVAALYMDLAASVKETARHLLHSLPKNPAK
jgi:hypothetical protein